MVDGLTLAGRRVLVAEDEILISMQIEEFLQEQGCEIVGPCASVQIALEAASASTLDIALLDINLIGGQVFPVAELLMKRNVPFLILSGATDLPALSSRAQWRICTKPFILRQLHRSILDELAKKSHLHQPPIESSRTSPRT